MDYGDAIIAIDYGDRMKAWSIKKYAYLPTPLSTLINNDFVKPDEQRLSLLRLCHGEKSHF